VLEGVSATGEYRGLYPQNELIYWREVWLERLSKSPDTACHARHQGPTDLPQQEAPR
jgi:hypothetical protein